ncbi:MAG TPA: TIGR03620 family F420-dependent LLM class oxidoreductase [Actinomycetota bacterium]|nr:TIGR03620 family F420-dependent LLM class oxidoreductase [Actinomycetota bacterium]
MEEESDLDRRSERDALREALGRVGVWSFALEALPAAEERDAAAEIESMGYRAIWFPEAVESREVFSHASWLLSSTERVVIASGIANIWARDATAMANGWRMLTDAFEGRFLLGLGVSHASSVRRRGSSYVRPLSAMRDYLDAMDRVSSSAPEPPGEPRMVLAALGPRMLGLAAERALGAHPYFVPVEHTAFARQRLGSGPVLAVEQTVVLESDPSEARAVGRQFAAGYLQSPNYANNLKRMGWTDADVSGQGSDAVIDAVVAWGDVDRIASRVRQHLDAGADHVCVQVVTDDDGDVALPQLRELAPALLEL